MNERIKELRRELDLTQEKFANKIGIKRNTLANYEIGRNEPIDGIVFSICREFNVNEEWLRNGTGEMFIKIDKENELMKWSAKILREENESFKKRFVSMLSQLEEKDWETLEKISLALHKND